MYKNILCALAAVFLAACATPYQREGLTGGYSDMQLNEDTYKVSFSGNGYSGQGYVQTLLLYRCAELTRDKGYRYFIITWGNENKESSQVVTPTTIRTQNNGSSTGSFSGYNYGNSFNGRSDNYYSGSSNTVIRPGMVRNVNSYADTVIIKMLHDNKKAPGAFNAELILASLQEKIRR